MFSIKSIYLQNYKSFNKLTFTLPTKPGFYYITGINKVDKELGGNGVGKSTLISSICWALFGKDQNGLIAGNIGNWIKGKNTEVGIEFSNPKLAITRTWNPNELVRNGMKVVDLYNDIPITYAAYLYSVLIGQFSTQFFDLQPADKLKVFSEILSLTLWEDCADRAKKLNDKIEIDLSKLMETLANTEGRLLEAQSQLETNKEKFEEYKLETNNTINILLGKLEPIKQELEKLESKANSFTVTINTLKKQVAELIQSRQNIMVKKDEIDISIKNKIQILGSLDGNINSTSKDLNKFKNIKTNLCPYCKQKVTIEHIICETNKLTTKVESLKGDRIKIQAILGKYNTDKTKLYYTLATIENKLTILQDSVDTNNQELNRVLQKTSELLKDAEHIGSQVSTYEKAVNPYKSIVEKAKTAIEEYKTKIEAASKDIAGHIKKNSMLKDITKYFKEVRLSLVEEALCELSAAINDGIYSLGLRNWNVNLVVDRDTKSGTLRKGFDMFIKSPLNNDFVPAKCFSGGEHSRLRLAVTFAIMDFIISRTGVEFDTEWWDEPTAWLSQTGIEALLEILRTRAISLKKRIFIIDHRDFESFDFTDTITIIKTKEGSMIL